MDPGMAEQLAEQEAWFSPLIVEPEGVTLKSDELGGVPVEWTIPADGPADEGLVVLYLHGGGYSNGLAKWARRATARLALGTGGRVVAPDYRLAPRFPFPAAQDDVLAVYQELISAAGFAPGRVAVAGDSAGGALTVTVMADARDRGIPMPACGMLNSLWADIAMNTSSLDDPVRNRYDIRKAMVVSLSETLLSTGGVDPYDPRHSPVYRDLSGLPPLLLQAAGRDICHDDSVRLAASAKAAGVDVTLTEYPDVDHIWILNGPWRLKYGDRFEEEGIHAGVEWVDSGAEAPEAITAIEEMCAFVERHAGKA
jgi:monoterpene epsilon-lactone hydrolase